MENKPESTPQYNRILLKISGESLMGERQFGLDPAMVNRVANEIATIVNYGVEVCVVIGGGNIFRGVSGAANGMERATADYMGMLATVMNALAMQSSLSRMVFKVVFSQLYQYLQFASRILDAVLFVTWRRNVLSFLQRVPVIRFLLLTQQRLFEQLKWVVMQYLRQQRLMVFMTRTQSKIKMQNAMMRSPI